MTRPSKAHSDRGVWAARTVRTAPGVGGPGMGGGAGSAGWGWDGGWGWGVGWRGALRLGQAAGGGQASFCHAFSLDLMVGEKKAISRGNFGYNGPCGCLGGHCAIQKSTCLYLFHMYTPPSIASAKNRPPPKMDLFVVGSSLQVRATRGLLFGLIDTMSAVDSGAITSLLRTSGSACCPWGLGSGESLC